MKTEPSSGAVEAAMAWYRNTLPIGSGTVLSLADLIDRLAVCPAVQEANDLWVKGGWGNQPQEIRRKLAAAEAERDKLIGDRQECCIKIGCLETTNAALREHRDSLEAERDRLREAAQTASVALDDWIHSYAPEECGEPYVTETYKRIRNGGGTLAYIAEVQSELRTALGEEDGDGEG